MTNIINIPLKKAENENKVIVVKIGSNAFKVNVDLSSIENLAVQMTNAGMVLEKLDSSNLEEVEKGLKLAYKTIFGKGAFKKVYDECGSLLICMDALYSSLNSIVTEIKKLQPSFEHIQEPVADTENKKKKKKKKQLNANLPKKQKGVVVNTEGVFVDGKNTKESVAEIIAANSNRI